VGLARFIIHFHVASHLSVLDFANLFFLLRTLNCPFNKLSIGSSWRARFLLSNTAPQRNSFETQIFAVLVMMESSVLGNWILGVNFVYTPEDEK